MRPGAAQTIREYLRAKVDCSKEKIYAELVLDNRVICYTLKDFLKRGEIERTVDGYRYIGRKQSHTQADRVWKAMRYLPAFSARELAMIANVDREYVTDILKRYKAAGFILNAGTRKRNVILGGRGTEILYKLKDRDIRTRPALRRHDNG